MARKPDIRGEPTKKRDYRLTDQGDHFMKARKRRVEVIARDCNKFDRLYEQGFKKLEVETYGQYQDVEPLDDPNV